MKISVIVATRNRAIEIQRFLDRLRQINHPKEWEIIVVDNGSHDDTSSRVNGFSLSLPIKTLFVRQAGKSRALNAAIEMASGDLLVFTDDDVIMDTDWLIAWEDAIARYPVNDVFGGCIRLKQDMVPDWILQSGNLQEMLVSLHDLGDVDRFYPPGRYPIGPNMAVRRRALLCSQAKWNISFGPGSDVPLGDEMAFLSCISKPSQSDRVYIAGAKIEHSPEARRLTYFQSWRRCFLGGVAAGRLSEFARTENKPIYQLIWCRLTRCKSFPEFVAISVRAIGVLVGRSSRDI